MKLPLIIYCITTILLLSNCDSKKDTVVRFSSESDSATAKIKQADSITTIRHAEYRGMHIHGSDPAKNAHQDVARMKRLNKQNALDFSTKSKSYQTNAERSKLRYQAYKDSVNKVQSLSETKE